MTKQEQETELAKMKPSTRAFVLEQCRRNGERMEREKRGDYGVPILITDSEGRYTD